MTGHGRSETVVRRLAANANSRTLTRPLRLVALSGYVVALKNVTPRSPTESLSALNSRIEDDHRSSRSSSRGRLTGIAPRCHGAACRRISRHFCDFPLPKKLIAPFRLNDFQCAKSNINRRLQGRTLCVGYSDYGG
jgi:hypothetical protein